MTEAGVSERRTKIVCTIGPASSSEEQLRSLIDAGMNVARLNFSHGTHEGHGRVIELVRRISDELRVPVAILQDIAGPKVRVGTFATHEIELEAGRPFTLTTREVEGSEEIVSVSYRELPGEVTAGEILLLADGTIELEAVEITDDAVRCRVLVGGPLSDRKGVNVPSGLFGLPILREKDRDDLRFGIENEVDYIGLSFVRTAEDVETAKAEIAKHGGDTPVIAKIGTKAALGNIEEILEAADGFMVARGDLGIETPFSEVPAVQKQLIARAVVRAKPVITATQMLQSMVEAPRPTRSEAADVANAALDGTDAVMLSDETAVGKHPTRAVRVMAATVRDTEAADLPLHLEHPEILERFELPASVSLDLASVAEAAWRMAERLDADVIAATTARGVTAHYLAAFRPRQPILAVANDARTCRRLALVRGVVPLLLEDVPTDPLERVDAAWALLQQEGWQGRSAVIVAQMDDDRFAVTTGTL